MDSQHTMYDWYFPTFYFEYNNLSDSYVFVLIISEEQQITSIKCWLHATTDHTTKQNQLK